MWKDHLTNSSTKKATFTGRALIISDRANINYDNWNIYIRLNRSIGVKLFKINCSEKTRNKSGKKGYDTIRKLKRSKIWRVAVKEMDCLNEAKSRMRKIPKGYAVIPVKRNGLYFPGLVMQHISGKSLEKIKHVKYNRRICIAGKVEEELLEVGIEHRDMHIGNVIKTYDNRYIPIDFDAYFVRFRK